MLDTFPVFQGGIWRTRKTNNSTYSRVLVSSSLRFLGTDSDTHGYCSITRTKKDRQTILKRISNVLLPTSNCSTSSWFSESRMKYSIICMNSQVSRVWTDCWLLREKLEMYTRTCWIQWHYQLSINKASLFICSYTRVDRLITVQENFIWRPWWFKFFSLLFFNIMLLSMFKSNFNPSSRVKACDTITLRFIISNFRDIYFNFLNTVLNFMWSFIMDFNFIYKMVQNIKHRYFYI